MLCADHIPGAARPAVRPAPAPRRGTGKGDAIITHGLTKRYGSRNAVDGLTITVPRGGVVGFVGPNGAGKTTTIRMLLGLVRPSWGTASVLGQPITHPARYLDSVGSLIESPAFYPYLSGRRNLRALARLGGHGTEHVDDLLAQVGLAERGDTPYKQYSLGMKQRLGIAASLLSDPELLILDEPTNGLDPAGIHEVRDFLRGLGNKGKTVFVSSHLLAEIQRMCDRLVVLRQGQLVFQGTVSELEARTQGIIAVPRDAAQVPDLVALCAKHGHAALEQHGLVSVQAPAAWAAELNQKAMKAGITLQELRPRAFDLEETILDMTGREVRH